MSKPLVKQDGTKSVIELPGVGIVIAVAATTSELGTGSGYAPGCIAILTTTKVPYYNNGTLTTASWSATA